MDTSDGRLSPAASDLRILLISPAVRRLQIEDNRPLLLVRPRAEFEFRPATEMAFPLLEVRRMRSGSGRSTFMLREERQHFLQGALLQVC